MSLPGELWEDPLSSFQWPVEPPTVDPDVEPFYHICFNASWRPYVLGALWQLLAPQTWQVANETERQQALDRAYQLLWQFQQECPLIPPGVIVAYGADTAPDEWLLCNGQAVSRTTYAALFAAIGATYGAGDGTTTFNLPDLRGRVPMGNGTGSGLTPRMLGDEIGEETHTLTNTEAPNHSHSDSGHTHTEIIATSVLINGGIEAPAASAIPSPGLTGTGFANLSSSGGNGAHNNVQPSSVVNFIIKT